ncbi:hypothetical protein F4778DRAFT_802664 [Xylariomycetidae sp. FL2044]|nr:hypothetical protein F4778DRAFT_802664 [Xylariomycetidae sp. FL2044]
MADTGREEFLRLRRRDPRNEAANFMETRVTIPGEADIVFSEQLNSFASLEEAKNQNHISDELWAQANAEKTTLFQLIEKARKNPEHRKTCREPQTDVRLCNWTEVMQEVHNASAKKPSKAKICIDRIGRNSDVFETWLQLLPSGDYGASICGVFTLAIRAADHYTKVEDVVFETLALIPECVKSAGRYVKIYSGHQDSSLERLTFDLFRSILRTLTHIMKFYTDSSTRKLCGFVLKQSSYKFELFKSLDEIKTNVGRIKEEAAQCAQERVYTNEKLLISTKLDLQEEMRQGEIRIVQTLYEFFLTHFSRVSEDEAFNAIQAETSPSIESIRRMGITGLSQEHDALQSKALMDGRESSRKLAGDVLQALEYDPELFPEDLSTCLELGEALDDRPRAKAASAARNEKLKQFIAGDFHSSALLLNGRDDLASAEGPSPLTYVAAQLASVFQSSGSAFVLGYFCDQHRPFSDLSVASSSRGMIASLTGQLLSQMLERGLETNLSFLTKVHWQRLQNLHLSTLCILFRELTDQLAPGTVLVCVIDEISRYETAARRKDTDAVMRRLTRLVSKRDEIVFKLLVTCRGRALEVGQYFVGQTVDLEEEVEASDGSRWMISTMSSAMSSNGSEG